MMMIEPKQLYLYVFNADSLAAREFKAGSFDDLPKEILDLIIPYLDEPSKDSLSWSCRKFYKLYANRYFYAQDYLNSCADLNYENLILHAAEQGYPMAHKVNGPGSRSYAYLLIDRAISVGYVFEKFIKTIPFTSEEADSLIFRAYYEGHLKIASKLVALFNSIIARSSTDLSPRFREKTSFEFLNLMINCGRCDLALNEYKKLTKEEQRELPKSTIFHRLFYSDNEKSILFAIKHDPALIGNLKQFVDKAHNLGSIELLETAKVEHIMKGSTIELHTPQTYAMRRWSLNYLKYLAEHFGIETLKNYQLSTNYAPTASVEALEWLLENNLLFISIELLIEFIKDNKKMQIVWTLSKIKEIPSDAFELLFIKTVKLRRIEILDLIFLNSYLKPNSYTLDTLIESINLEYNDRRKLLFPRGLRKTIRWLLERGYTWGKGKKAYQEFKRIYGALADPIIKEFSMPV